MSRAFRDLTAFLFIAGTVIVGLVFGLGWIVNSGTSMIDGVAESVSDWGITKEDTAQVRIHETEETKRTGIVVDGLVRVEEIRSNTAQRTSGWGLAHRGADGLRLAITCITFLGFLVVLWFISMAATEKRYR